MKRDIETIKKVLLRIEESEGWTVIEGDPNEIYNAQLAVDAGLLKAGEPVRRASDGNVMMLPIDRLTIAGHDFLDSSKDEGTWKSVKGYISKGGAWTLGVVIEMMKQVAIDQAKRQFGLE